MKQPCIEMKQLFNIKVCNKQDLYCAICNSISSQEILIFPKTVIKKYLQKSSAIQEHCHIQEGFAIGVLWVLSVNCSHKEL